MELCEKDSDGDGMKNGEELGDPDCTWAEDETPVYLAEPKGHPGNLVRLLQSFPKEMQHFFWRRVYRSESGDSRLHDPDPGPQEKSTEKSCISFGKDCKSRYLELVDL